MARLQSLNINHLLHRYTSLPLNLLQLSNRPLRPQRIIETSTPLPHHINSQTILDMDPLIYLHMLLRREAGHHHPSIKKDGPHLRIVRTMNRATLGPRAPRGFRQAGTRQPWRRSGVNFSTKIAIRHPGSAISCVGLQCTSYVDSN